MKNKCIAILLAVGLLIPVWVGAVMPDDFYEKYVKSSRDFQCVRQDADWALKAYPSWVFMPWYYQWSIGYDAAAGDFCRSTGINGAFVDHGDSSRLGWINSNQLRFYMDHAVGKGDLHLGDSKVIKPHLQELTGTGVRFKPLNQAMKTKLEGILKKNIEAVMASPMRSAYALDDEISWGSFVRPCMWKVTDDAAAYQTWLKEIYGPRVPQRQGWVGYNDIRQKLSKWDVASFDGSPLMDQWTFNDSYWNNFIGDLVTFANSIDPATPCGYVGGQSPNAFGGYDYAKIMRKVQFVEGYNLAQAQSIIRSFNPQNALPTVTTFFFELKDFWKSKGSDDRLVVADAQWQCWYYLAQGNRGHIAWVEGWFKNKLPQPWFKAVSPTITECAQTIGPLMSGAKWKHDGIAVYYSHPSIQLGWIMDAAAHGSTWSNRNGDHSLGSSHRNRNAWLNMLRDEGLQFNWISYADVIQKGIPAQYKVLILPAALCLSDVEVRKIREFCEAGGTVIADYLPGLWDQHGKGRDSGGALDDLFGVKHDPKMTAKDVFNGNSLWCEVDQEANFFNGNTRPSFMTTKNSCIKDASGFNKAVRNMGTVKIRKVGLGTAVLMNLSPQWYNVYRASGYTEAAQRSVFMKPIHDAGLKRWVEIKNADATQFTYEITYWTKGGRMLLFLIPNKEVAGTEAGGGAAIGLKTETVPVTLVFTRSVNNVKDERTGKALGSGREFSVQWKMNEACVLSFDNVLPTQAR